WYTVPRRDRLTRLRVSRPGGQGCPRGAVVGRKAGRRVAEGCPRGVDTRVDGSGKAHRPDARVVAAGTASVAGSASARAAVQGGRQRAVVRGACYRRAGHRGERP